MLTCFRQFVAFSLALIFLSATIVPVSASCVLPEDHMSYERLDMFLSRPADLLAKWPFGGEPLAIEARGFAAAGAASLGAVIGLIPSASSTQLIALGQGLGRAQVRCERIDPDVASRISLAVMRISRQDVLAGYRHVLMDDAPQTTKLPSLSDGGAGHSFDKPKVTGDYFFPRATDRDKLTITDPFQQLK